MVLLLWNPDACVLSKGFRQIYEQDSLPLAKHGFLFSPGAVHMHICASKQGSLNQKANEEIIFNCFLILITSVQHDSKL